MTRSLTGAHDAATEREVAVIEDNEGLIADTSADTATGQAEGGTNNTAVETEDAAKSAGDGADTTQSPKDPRVWKRVIACGVLPAVALSLAVAAGWLKWHEGSIRDAEIARVESVEVATTSTIAMLSYRPDTVENELSAASDRLTGAFRDSYTSLIRDVVIPGAKQQQIATVATVPSAASVTASPAHAVVLVFVNQSSTVGAAPPTETASSIRVTLDKVGDRWLISDFTPV